MFLKFRIKPNGIETKVRGLCKNKVVYIYSYCYVFIQLYYFKSFLNIILKSTKLKNWKSILHNNKYIRVFSQNFHFYWCTAVKIKLLYIYFKSFSIKHKMLVIKNLLAEIYATLYLPTEIKYLIIFTNG